MTTLTLKLGGSLLQDPAILQGVAEQLNQLVSAGVRPVVVHGGGAQISRALADAGIPETRHRGLRVTPPEAATIVQQEMDALGLELTASLVRAGCPGFHVPARTGRLAAKPKGPIDGVDLGRVGTPTGFDGLGLPGPVGGPVPVVTPVGSGPAGALNVNADEAAAVIAKALGSDLLVLATGVPGVFDRAGSLLDHLTPGQARQLIADGTAQAGMVPKLHAALAGLHAGIHRVVITDLATGRLPGLLGQPEPEHAGTMLTATEVPA